MSTVLSTTSICVYPSGNFIDLMDPDPDLIEIRDIAHGLAHLCRFTGHVRRFMSVAEHSVNVSLEFEDPLVALCALMHDGSEAYLGDVSTPLKSLIPDYWKLEHDFQMIINQKFCGAANFPEVKKADLEWYYIESSFLTRNAFVEYSNPPRVPACWNPLDAELRFLERYQELVDVLQG